MYILPCLTALVIVSDITQPVSKMKVAIALCLMCVVAMVYGQAPRAATTGSSDALRAMVAQRMLGGRGGAGGMGRMGGLSTLMLLRGKTNNLSHTQCIALCTKPKVRLFILIARSDARRQSCL